MRERSSRGSLAALKRSGINVLSQDESDSVGEVEEAIADAGTLSRKINAWESRWPLNTYARDINRSGLSKTMQEPSC